MAEIVHLNIDPDEPVTQIQSMCTNCQEQGTTSLLLCKVPFFKDIVIMSFSCEECGYTNNDIQSAAALAERGVRITLHVSNQNILNRQVVKSEHAVITIPEIGLEIPKTTQKGSFNTVEGILSKTKEQLEWDQPLRRAMNPELADQMEVFFQNIQGLLDGNPFTLILDDPSGNSFIAHDLQFTLPQNDPSLHIEHYNRTREQLIEMGFLDEAQELSQQVEDMSLNDPLSIHGMNFEQPLDENQAMQEPVEFPTECFACYRQGTCKMAVTNIPNFKEVIVMSFVCDFCGAKSNEIRGGGAVSEFGTETRLFVTQMSDLSRDVVKSATAKILIPEIGLEMGEGTLGGQVTTVEGILNKVYEDLQGALSFGVGDSNTAEENERFRSFLNTVRGMADELAQPFTLIIDDPLSNSYIAGDPDDENLVIRQYTRTQEQDEELGLLDMKVD